MCVCGEGGGGVSERTELNLLHPRPILIANVDFGAHYIQSYFIIYTQKPVHVCISYVIHNQTSKSMYLQS